MEHSELETSSPVLLKGDKMELYCRPPGFTVLQSFIDLEGALQSGIMLNMYSVCSINKQNVELALKEASISNPGAWVDHSRYVAEACKNIALHCKNLSAEQAYLFGLLHDIGRYAGVSSERHLI